MDVALAVFGAQSKSPSREYLGSIQSFISQHPVLHCIKEEIQTLNEVYDFLSAADPRISALKSCPRYTKSLTDWILDGNTGEVATIFSGIVSLPRLAIVQLAQYFSFLADNGLEHSEFVAQTSRLGGIQGFCGGLPAAAAVASAVDDAGLKRSICTAIRIAYAIGVYAEMGDDSEVPGITTLVVRLKNEGQADELIEGFPGVYISARTDPKSASIVGPVEQLAILQELFRERGLLSQGMDIRGKTHNPENRQLGQELVEICQRSSLLDMGDAKDLKTPIRSNKLGVQRLTSGSLTGEIVTTILCDRCEWYDLLNAAAVDIKTGGARKISIACFGIGDCTSLMPFHKQGLTATKRQWTVIADPKANGVSRDIDTQYPDNAVAVVGASCRLPGARTLEEYWDIISKGRDMHRELPTDRFDLRNSHRASLSRDYVQKRKFYGNFVDNIDHFDHSFFNINPREAVNMDPQQRMLLELAYEAVESSGYMRNHDRSRGDNIGCFIGASFVEYLDNTSAHPPTAYTSTGTIRAFLCGRLSWFFGWTGPAEVVDTACSSSLVAVNRAVKAIQNGECSSALVGGVNIISGIANYMDLGKAGFLSPTGQCKPFDAAGDGYCRSEGGALIFLKPFSKAAADGDHMLAVIPGTGTNQGGLSCALTVPDSDSLGQLYQSVLERSHVAPEAVSYVEAHGTGTQAGDPVEIASIRKVFGSAERQSELHVGSVKGNIGHAETCAGIAGLVKVICMLNKRSIPPQANHRIWNPKIPSLGPDRMALSLSLQPWKQTFRAALVNSYGAAGSNAAALCCEAPEPGGAVQNALESGTQGYPIIVSAKSEASLKAHLSTLAAHLKRANPRPHISKVAYTLCHQRKRYRHSVIFEHVRDTEDLIHSLETNRGQIKEPEKPNGVVLLFSGQSKKIVGLARDLYDRHAAFRLKLDACDAILQDLGHPSILPAVFETDDMEDTVPLQTGLVAVQYSLAMCWIEAGIAVSAIVGHSLGELAALAVSGVLSLQDCLKLVASRAALIKSHWGSDRGAMLACAASADQLQSTIDSLGLPIDVACYNASNGQVVAGGTEAIERLEAHLKALPTAVKCRRVNTSHAFHSRLMEPVLADLENVAATLDCGKPTLPIHFCTTDGRLPDDKYSPSAHAREPVFFEKRIKHIENSVGKAAWIEVGVDSPVINMTRAVVSTSKGHSFHPMSATSKVGAAPADILAQTICGLWRSGVDVSYWQFMTTSSARGAIWLPPYQFEKKSMWLENIDHAALLQQKIDTMADGKPLATTRESASALPIRLVNPLFLENDRCSEWLFEISPQSRRFRSIVSGHAVRNRPLCPASVYMECVAMAVNILHKAQQPRVEFSKLEMQAPLGVGSIDMELVLVATGKSEWKFSISSKGAENSKKRNLHAQGSVRIDADAASKLEVAARFVQRRMQDLQKSDDGEKVMAKRAYGLFSRVVAYADFLKGISSIAMYDSEAIAKIVVQPNQPSQEESTAVSTCEAVAMDNFIQVVGLLINTSDLVGPTEVMVCTAVDYSTTMEVCDMAKETRWTVHASFTPANSSNAKGDVFVFTSEGALAAAFTGCRFTKVEMARLERALDSAGGQVNPQQDAQATLQPASRQAAPPQAKQEDVLALSSGSSTASSSPASKAQSSIGEDLLLTILERYTGAEPRNIEDSMNLADLGLDSLAAVEFAGEIGSTWQVEIDPSELLEMSVGGLRKTLPYSVAATNATTPSDHSDSEDHSSEQSKATQLSSAREAAPVADAEKMVLSLLTEVTGAAPGAIKRNMALVDVGVDSLAMIEFAAALPGLDPEAVDNGDISLDSTVGDVLKALGHTADTGENDSKPQKEGDARSTSSSLGRASASAPFNPQELKKASSPVLDIEAAMSKCEAALPTSAKQHGFSNYWAGVAPQQNDLILAYIREAFAKLGVDLASLQPGEVVPSVPHQAKHSRLMERLWEILEDNHMVKTKDGNQTVCEKATKVAKPSELLYDELLQQDEWHSVEARLLALTGPKLAECLSGKYDGAKLLFGTDAAMKTLEQYYARSPVLASSTSQMVSLIDAVLGGIANSPSHVLRILEVGGGTGGTTGPLLGKLSQSQVPVEYVFTDISPSLLSKAKRKFSKYGSLVTFTKFDLEGQLPADLVGSFDIVLGTNCVHATKNRTSVCAKIGQMLKATGFMVLSEITKVIDWYDLVFGLLDGWWLDEIYPLQPADHWMQIFQKAGFRSMTHSLSSSEDLNTQQLLVASKSTLNGQPDGPTSRRRIASAPAELSRAIPMLLKESLVYKTVEDVQIGADLYLPEIAPQKPMPIAVLIHGGGHMTLSRQAVRPWQIALLLAMGIMPVSIDYRLAPEINIIDGAMTDVRDAVHWARTELPAIAKGHGVLVDPRKVAVVGWSSGGHLAMSSAWTLPEAGLPPPDAILSFYAPVDFLGDDLFPRNKVPIRSKMALGELLESPLRDAPMTDYTMRGGEEPDLGWVKRGDVRSECLLALFRGGQESLDFGLSLMMNGRPGQHRTVGDVVASPPSLERRAAACPTARLRGGNYKVPTYIIHGEDDNIAPFRSGLAFHRAMQRQGRRSGFLTIVAGQHLHDLRLKPDTPAWSSQVEPGYVFLRDVLQG